MWDTLVLDPMVNALVWLYGLFSRNYLLTILVFAVLIRLVVLPFVWRQRAALRRMRELQPQIDRLKNRYGKDPVRLNRQINALYREAGINPLLSLLTSLLPSVILFGPYRAVSLVLAYTPAGLFDLAQHVYPTLPVWLAWLPEAARVLPFDDRFLWLNLGAPDPLLILPVLVAISAWLAARLAGSAAPQSEAQSAGLNRAVAWSLPAMLGFFALHTPSGIVIYWIVANVLAAVQPVLIDQVSRLLA